MFTPSSCKDIGIRNFEFVEKTKFLPVLNSYGYKPYTFVPTYVKSYIFKMHKMKNKDKLKNK